MISSETLLSTVNAHRNLFYVIQDYWTAKTCSRKNALVEQAILLIRECDGFFGEQAKKLIENTFSVLASTDNFFCELECLMADEGILA